DDAARLRAIALDHLLRGLGLDEHRLAVLVVVLADLGHREAPGRALQQAHAEPRLEQRAAAAELRLRDAEGTAGGREATVLDDLHEVVEIVQVGHGHAQLVPPAERSMWLGRSGTRTVRGLLSMETREE